MRSWVTGNGRSRSHAALGALLVVSSLAIGCASRGPVPEAAPEPSELEAMSFPETLPIPVDGVDNSELSSSFEASRSGGRRHRAIDIFAPRNTPVRATTSGYVTRRKVLSLGGKTISIVGPAGYRHYFAHLEGWAKPEVGDFVTAGEIVGYVGNSGNAKRGPTHLHYAVYLPWGDPIDPFDLLRRGRGSFESR